MKKFKNNIVVTGSKPLLAAFEKELLSLGYSEDSWNDEYREHPNTIWIAVYGKGIFRYHNHNCSPTPAHNLFTQYGEALKAARELEEEIPEYIKVLKTDCYNVSASYGYDVPVINNIYKVNKSLSTQENKLIFWVKDEESYLKITFVGAKEGIDFERSTKEAYLQQQKEIQDKELLEKLIKESGFKVRDIVKVTSKSSVGWVQMGSEGAYPTKGIYNKIFIVNGFKLIDGLLYISQEHNDGYILCSTISKYISTKTLTLGDKNIKVTISKDKIEAEGKQVKYSDITDLIQCMSGFSSISGWEVKHDNAKIGCSVFMLTELQQIVTTYNELNK